MTYAYAGAPEPVAVDQDRAGKVLRVELEETSTGRTVTLTERPVGKTRFEKLDLDAPGSRPSRPSSKASDGSATPTSSSMSGSSACAR